MPFSSTAILNHWPSFNLELDEKFVFLDFDFNCFGFAFIVKDFKIRVSCQDATGGKLVNSSSVSQGISTIKGRIMLPSSS